MGASVTYNLTGSGWSECYIQIGEQSAHLSASYLSDAFGDLLNAVVGLMNGAKETTASFEEEPGEYRWRFRQMPPDKVNVRILKFDDIWAKRPDEQGKTILEAECRLRTFAGAVLSASQRVLQEHGLEGYKDKWIEHEFPLDLQQQLKRLLDTDEGRAKTAQNE